MPYALVRLPHSRRGDSQGRETFLAPSTDKQTHNYDTECSNHHPSPSTLRSKGLGRSKMNGEPYTNSTVNTIVRLPHDWNEGSQDQGTFLAASSDKQTRNI